MAKADEPQCVVIEYVLPAAQPTYYGPDTREACESFKASRDAKALPRGVSQRDVVVVELAPLPSS